MIFMFSLLIPVGSLTIFHFNINKLCFLFFSQISLPRVFPMLLIFSKKQPFVSLIFCFPSKCGLYPFLLPSLFMFNQLFLFIYLSFLIGNRSQQYGIFLCFNIEDQCCRGVVYILISCISLVTEFKIHFHSHLIYLIC